MHKKICLTTIICTCCCALAAFFAPLSFASVTTITLSPGTQALFAKDIPLDMSVQTAQVISQVRIQWIIPYGLHTPFGVKTDYNTSIAPGALLQDHLVVVPDYPGTYPITATVSGLSNGQPFTESATTNISIDSNLQLQENANIHTVKFALYIVLCIASLAVFVILIRDVYNDLRIRFFHWLNKEA